MDSTELTSFLIGRLAGPGHESRTLSPALTLIRRKRPGNHMVDVLDIPGSGSGGSLAILNPSLFDAFLAAAPGARDLSALESWLGDATGAVLETNRLFHAEAADLVLPIAGTGLSVRLLDPDSAADAAAFAAFDAACPPADLAAGFVELDHDIVAGVFRDGKLIAKASAFPFMEDDEGDSPVWDIGYVTLPAARGSGCARLAAALVAREVIALDAVAQIRADDGNPASQAVARALGFRMTVGWRYPESDE